MHGQMFGTSATLTGQVLRLDLTDSQDSVRGTIKQAVAFYERVDVLVNVRLHSVLTSGKLNIEADRL